MAILPVTYVSQVGFIVGWGASTALSTSFNLSMPALSATCVNPAIVFTGDGVDWDGTWTFFDSDGTQDTDFALVFNNTGGSGGHNDLQVYVRTDASKYDGRILNPRYLPGLTGYVGNARGMWFENVNQIPSCDTIMSTASISAHAAASTFSLVLGMGIATAYDDKIASFSVWSGGTEFVNSSGQDNASTDGPRRRSFYCYEIPPDTASSDYSVGVTPATSGDYNRYAFEIFAYEIVLSDLVGTLTFTGNLDRKISLTRFLAGTLSFTQGVLVTLKRWKVWTTAIIRMWLEPQSDDIELDVEPRGFTDIGES